MKPLSQLTAREASELRGLLFDLDDTLLDHGRLSEKAYQALFRLKEAGLELYIVTGRPLGWVEVLARLWPVDGAIAENGAVAVVEVGGHPTVLDRILPAERDARGERLRELVRALKERYPELTPASDVSARRSDFTFDIGETRQVPTEVVEAASAEARRHGAFTTASSVHLHVTFDRADKASGALWLLSQRSNTDSTTARFRYAFVGDSENDAACFAAFHTSIGVANLRGRLTVPPRFLTSRERGAGFAELALRLVALRRAPCCPMGRRARASVVEAGASKLCRHTMRSKMSPSTCLGLMFGYVSRTSLKDGLKGCPSRYRIGMLMPSVYPDPYS